MTFVCRRIVAGLASGKALVSKDPICFYLVNPETGEVIEEGHALQGRSVAGRILVFPAGKGSSVVQADGLYQLAARGNAPRALIVRHLDTVLVASAVILNIPMVTDVPDEFYSYVTDGCQLTVDAQHELIRLGS